MEATTEEEPQLETMASTALLLTPRYIVVRRGETTTEKRK